MAYTTIKKPSDYFDTRTYSASGAGSISDLNFQPDFIWFKNRTIVGDHGLFDAIRGVTKYLISNSTSTGLTGNGTTSDFLSFDTNGFTYGTSSQLDVGAGTPVTWCWKANGTGSSNTDGSITSTVSANTTSGFSIVNFTKTDGEVTVGHGLNAKPSLIIFKPLATANWIVTPEINGSMANNYLLLNSTDALGTGGAFSNPTTSVFSISNNIAPNSEHIAYCFAEKQGFSKFGSYTGNGNADGAFVYTGFKPAWVLIKRSSGVESWYTFDNKRDTSNVVSKGLVPNQNIVEFNYDSLDFTSNGFKIRTSAVNYNASGDTYIYMAFAEEPLVGDNPCTAR